MVMFLDDKLRRRIAWLNTAGGFGNSIVYTRVAEAADGLDEAKVMAVLKYVEDNWDKVWDATAWICSSLKKAKVASEGLDADLDEQLRKRIRWLNNAGGFENKISYSKIAEASVGLKRNKVMEVLKYLEDSWQTVEDPTAWVCSALRKAAATGRGSGTEDSAGAWDSWGGDWTAGGQSWGTVASWGKRDKGDAGPDALWQCVSWLNGPGGFKNRISYPKVAQEAKGVSTGKALELLYDLEAKWEKVGDPTAWVCSSLRRAREATQGLSQYLDKQMRSRIRWLNTHGGFENTILYTKVAEAAVGVESQKVMEILKYLEARLEEVDDPTAWVCAALNKVKSTAGRQSKKKSDQQDEDPKHPEAAAKADPKAKGRQGKKGPR